LLSREVYLAIVDEAKRMKIPVEGHVPVSMTAEEVSDLGQLTIEHNFDVLVSSSTDEVALRKPSAPTPDGGAQSKRKQRRRLTNKKRNIYLRRSFATELGPAPPLLSIVRSFIYLTKTSF